MSTVKAYEIVEAARKYVGSPYRWWTGAFPEYGPPGYMDWQNPGYYTPAFVRSEGVHCAGLVNLARMECGLEPIGLTRAYEDWIWANGGESFSPDTPGVPGAICVKGWEWGSAPGVAEGHIAIYTDAHTIIQAEATNGVWEGDTDYGSHWWAGYAAYGLMPDVEYDDTPIPSPPQLANWFGIGADGVVRVGGDWSKGWIGQDESGYLRRVYEYPE